MQIKRIMCVRTCALAAAALLTVGIPRLNAQSVSPADLEVRTFLLRAYPELAGRPIQVDVAARADTTQVAVSEIVLDKLRLDGPNTPLLTAQVQFTAQHELRSFEARGALLRETDNATLAASVSTARRTGGDVNAEIARAALAFGPSQQSALLARLDSLHLDSRIGTLHIVAATPLQPPNDARFGFLWRVDVEGVRNGTVRRYSLEFEPFDGRLVSWSER